MKTLRLGVFASGRGSNFSAILNAIDAGRLNASVAVLVSNDPAAGALETARSRGIRAETVSSAGFESRGAFVARLTEVLRESGAGFIALAGYMKRVPPEVVALYPGRIVNIHPALLPAFGGKGMYGRHVHEAVIRQGCKVTGVTVHLVDEQYDRGPILAQRCVPVLPGDTPETLAGRVLETEHALYPEVLQAFAEGRVRFREGIAFIE
ncbi:MAG: phosphoribosylglycinamide formyltransferase [bacterium]|nr:phosphoribosylglycinamide formyltransferase [bacterium]